MAEPAPLPLTFEDVAIYFSEQEWRGLEAWQKELYKQVMRTNYEILVSLDDGLPKPELISWIEQGRELFRNWGESQRSGNVICPSADVHFDPVTEEQLFWGSQQAVSSGEAHRHSQVDPLQSQCFSEPLFGKSDVSFRLDQAVNLLRPHRRDTRTLISIVYSSPEGVPSPRTLGLPGFQEISSWVGLLHLCPVCGESFWKKNLLEQHQRNHSRGLPYGAWKQFSKQADTQQPQSIPRGQRHFRSPECGRGFHWKQCLLRHLAVHAGESPLQGPECKVCFPPERTQFGHPALWEGARPSPCPGDDQSTPQSSPRAEMPVSWKEGAGASSEKVETPHPRSGKKPDPRQAGEERGRRTVGPEALEPSPGEETPFSCGTCGRRFSQQRRLADLAQVPGAERPFPCAECGQAFRRRGPLIRCHRRPHPDEKPFPCPECGLGFRLRSRLRAHRLRHGGERPFSCGECGRGFAHPCKLREHLRVHSGERPFRCPECSKSFRLKGILKAHQRTHSRERPFQCGECGKGFTRPSKLAEHFRVHSGERPFGCPDCGRRFRLKGQLRSHQRLHTGERPFPCPDCGKRYRVKADMKAHRLLHGGQMPFSCECGKGFAKQSKLVEHVRTHTGEKPFQCPKCDKSFRLKAQLLSHQGLHTGERPFRCPECGKSFRERGHMLRHQRIHRPERPFSCADCGKGFIYKSKLAEHIRVHTKSCRTPSEPDVKKRLSQLFAMIEADWS
ncbi:zinc finger protein 786 [Camelus bactrianus]|uniref:Zinc finger protein 786 n=1 Tax=Camelus bactrianus TaxID=9837 RepID=A0AC58QKZ8_CAMBA